MIKVTDLTKKYHNVDALQGVSFEVKKGEIVGFLGANGAGKTTTMRIITGYMPMTSGTVTVDGYDVFEDSLEVRKKIGYLPETTPLYQDMTVWEYLNFAADLKQFDKENRKEHLEEVMGKVNLTDVKDAIIKTLSKGYKQRVGIAQALVGDPEVLILDEPTIGLDPNQIVDIRKLIKSLGKDKTVILSTHILQEVSATCDRVIIINNGKIVATDTPQNLTGKLAKGGMKVTVEVRGPEMEVVKCLEGLEKTVSAKNLGSKNGVVTVEIEAKKGDDPREVISSAIIRNDWGLIDMKKEEMDLEDIFIKLTNE